MMFRGRIIYIRCGYFASKSYHHLDITVDLFSSNNQTRDWGRYVRCWRKYMEKANESSIYFTAIIITIQSSSASASNNQ
eukprot:scaffold9614_cov91-Skeletonema_dohrnii-CCMP3373.AAC.4